MPPSNNTNITNDPATDTTNSTNTTNTLCITANLSLKFFTISHWIVNLAVLLEDSSVQRMLHAVMSTSANCLSWATWILLVTSIWQPALIVPLWIYRVHDNLCSSEACTALNSHHCPIMKYSPLLFWFLPNPFASTVHSLGSMYLLSSHLRMALMIPSCYANWTTERRRWRRRWRHSLSEQRSAQSRSCVQPKPEDH